MTLIRTWDFEDLEISVNWLCSSMWMCTNQLKLFASPLQHKLSQDCCWISLFFYQISCQTCTSRGVRPGWWIHQFKWASSNKKRLKTEKPLSKWARFTPLLLLHSRSIMLISAVSSATWWFYCLDRTEKNHVASDFCSITELLISGSEPPVHTELCKTRFKYKKLHFLISL